MNVPFLDLKAQYQSIKTEMDAAMQAIVDTAAFVGGKAVDEFEKKFAAYIGAQHCIGVGNGTDALWLALKTLGIGPGDEVLTVANSFVATAEAVTAAGTRVVFADCHPDWYTIDTRQIEAKLTKKTRAIIPVHLYGQPADMQGVMDIARRHSLRVIEDCAQAHGARYRGRRVGTFGDLACFSFYPGKNLGAYGDGGAVVANEEGLAQTCRMLANHGRIDKYDHQIEGYNSRLDGLQAAVLGVKLAHLDAWNVRRRETAALYRQQLAGIPGIVAPREMDGGEPVYHLFVVRAERREALMAFLKERGIQTGIHYPIGLPFLKAYAYLKHRPEDFPVTYAYQSRLLSLPIDAEMTEEMVRYVAESIRAFAAR